MGKKILGLKPGAFWTLAILGLALLTGVLSFADGKVGFDLDELSSVGESTSSSVSS